MSDVSLGRALAGPRSPDRVLWTGLWSGGFRTPATTSYCRPRAARRGSTDAAGGPHSVRARLPQLEQRSGHGVPASSPAPGGLPLRRAPLHRVPAARALPGPRRRPRRRTRHGARLQDLRRRSARPGASRSSWRARATSPAWSRPAWRCARTSRTPSCATLMRRRPASSSRRGTSRSRTAPIARPDGAAGRHGARAPRRVLAPDDPERLRRGRPGGGDRATGGPGRAAGGIERAFVEPWLGPAARRVVE